MYCNIGYEMDFRFRYQSPSLGPCQSLWIIACLRKSHALIFQLVHCGFDFSRCIFSEYAAVFMTNLLEIIEGKIMSISVQDSCLIMKNSYRKYLQRKVIIDWWIIIMAHNTKDPHTRISVFVISKYNAEYYCLLLSHSMIMSWYYTIKLENLQLMNLLYVLPFISIN